MKAQPKEKHLELLQGVITRMANNGFLLKGWSVTLVAAVLALGAEAENLRLLWIAFLPALLFWGLDGYFLAQERLFRKLYEAVILPDTQVPAYSLKIAGCNIGCWAGSTFSWTLVFFHGGLVIALLLLIKVVGIG